MISPRIRKIDRIKGMLWGALIGDSFGALFEFTPRSKMPILDGDYVIDIYQHSDLVNNVFGYPVGTITDDGIQIMITIESLLQNNMHINIRDIRFKFRDWYYEGYWTPDGECFDIGGTTLEGLLFAGNPLFRIKATKKSEGNGSLMRLPAIAGLKTLHLEDIIKFIQITHRTESKDFYRVQVDYVNTLRNILSGKIPKRVGTKSLMTTKRYQPTGDAMSTARLALTVFRYGPESYLDGLCKVVSFGNDTDTNGCVYGALKGAAVGYSNIPKWMIDPMWNKDKISALIEEFAEKACTS